MHTGGKEVDLPDYYYEGTAKASSYLPHASGGAMWVGSDPAL